MTPWLRRKRSPWILRQPDDIQVQTAATCDLDRHPVANLVMIIDVQDYPQTCRMAQNWRNATDLLAAV